MNNASDTVHLIRIVVPGGITWIFYGWLWLLSKTFSNEF